MSEYSASFLREVADHIRSCNYGSEKNNAHAAVEAARFDAMAVEQEDAERLAVDIGRAAIEASEGVAYGSKTDDFFRAAGQAVLFWLPLNGWKLHVTSPEPVAVHVHHHDIEAHAASFNEGYDEAVRQLTEPAEEPISCRDPECDGCNAAEYPAPSETGPWPSLSDVPAEVRKVIDANGDEWLRRSDIEWFGCAEGGITGVCRAGHPNLAPFNAVLIETKWQTWQEVPEGVKSVRDRTGQCWRYYPFIGWSCDFPGHRSQPMNDFAPFVAA